MPKFPVTPSTRHGDRLRPNEFHRNHNSSSKNNDNQKHQTTARQKKSLFDLSTQTLTVRTVEDLSVYQVINLSFSYHKSNCTVNKRADRHIAQRLIRHRLANQDRLCHVGADMTSNN
ncbi:hypothetical protein GQX74_007151 [Glossina fuscipes]|nr:hypothetical protein GQX74_007151 [Glossina fuscipes]